MLTSQLWSILSRNSRVDNLMFKLPAVKVMNEQQKLTK